MHLVEGEKMIDHHSLHKTYIYNLSELKTSYWRGCWHLWKCGFIFRAVTDLHTYMCVKSRNNEDYNSFTCINNRFDNFWKNIGKELD